MRTLASNFSQQELENKLSKTWGQTWGFEETNLLLDVWGDYSQVQNMNEDCPKRNLEDFQQIVQKLHRSKTKFARTVEECRAKKKRSCQSFAVHVVLASCQTSVFCLNTQVECQFKQQLTMPRLSKPRACTPARNFKIRLYIFCFLWSLFHLSSILRCDFDFRLFKLIKVHKFTKDINSKLWKSAICNLKP